MSDSARFKCWGSGFRNEETAGRLLGKTVPQMLRAAVDDGAEYAWLEWVHGEPPRASDAFFLDAGRTLARIHGQPGPYWGSLDGVWRFASFRDALGSRFNSAIQLLSVSWPDLAHEAWTRGSALIGRIDNDRSPALVHGDFGLSNLIVSDGIIRVLDWEHARWGDPIEDWAKIWLATKLAEPNHCGDTRAVTLVECGWSEFTGRGIPRDPDLELLMEIYLCSCLGVFFDKPANPWLRRLGDLVRESHPEDAASQAGSAAS